MSDCVVVEIKEPEPSPAGNPMDNSGMWFNLLGRTLPKRISTLLYSNFLPFMQGTVTKHKLNNLKKLKRVKWSLGIRFCMIRLRFYKAVRSRFFGWVVCKMNLREFISLASEIYVLCSVFFPMLLQKFLCVLISLEWWTWIAGPSLQPTSILVKRPCWIKACEWRA